MVEGAPPSSLRGRHLPALQRRSPATLTPASAPIRRTRAVAALRPAHAAAPNSTPGSSAHRARMGAEPRPDHPGREPGQLPEHPRLSPDLRRIGPPTPIAALRERPGSMPRSAGTAPAPMAASSPAPGSRRRSAPGSRRPAGRSAFATGASAWPGPAPPDGVRRIGPPALSKVAGRTGAPVPIRVGPSPLSPLAPPTEGGPRHARPGRDRREGQLRRLDQPLRLGHDRGPERPPAPGRAPPRPGGANPPVPPGQSPHARLRDPDPRRDLPLLQRRAFHERPHRLEDFRGVGPALSDPEATRGGGTGGGRDQLEGSAHALGI